MVHIPITIPTGTIIGEDHIHIITIIITIHLAITVMVILPTTLVTTGRIFVL